MKLISFAVALPFSRWSLSTTLEDCNKMTMIMVRSANRTLHHVFYGAILLFFMIPLVTWVIILYKGPLSFAFYNFPTVLCPVPRHSKVIFGIVQDFSRLRSGRHVFVCPRSAPEVCAKFFSEFLTTVFNETLLHQDQQL